MFTYDFAHWASFGLAALLLNMTPGPDFAFILGHTIRGGRRAGFAALFGIWTGALGHVVLAAVGLSALVAASALAFSLVKWVGVAYLCWLGVQALRSKENTLATHVPPPGGSPARIFGQGVLIDLLNPKVALFFLAFLPQFVEPGAGPTWAQLALHGVLIVAVSALVEPPIILLGDRMGRGLRANPRFGLWLDRSLGGLFIALGARLALQER
jgi:threonine/homoserine/homoserine lactone efflux protein